MCGPPVGAKDREREMRKSKIRFRWLSKRGRSQVLWGIFLIRESQPSCFLSTVATKSDDDSIGGNERGHDLPRAGGQTDHRLIIITLLLNSSLVKTQNKQFQFRSTYDTIDDCDGSLFTLQSIVLYVTEHSQ